MTRADAISAFVRALIAVMFSGALVYGFLWGPVSTDAFIGIAGVAIGYWFRGEQAKAEVRAAVESVRKETG